MSRKIRRLLAFLIAVIAVQGLALLFFTPAGLERVFVLPLRLHAEQFKPDNNTYAVYYDSRADVAKADLIVVSVDPNVAESFDALGHFTRYLKQYNDFSAVLMPLTAHQIALTSNIMRQTDEERFDKRIQSLREATGMSADCCDYLSELFYINTTMSAVKKFTVSSYYDEEADTGAAERIAGAFGSTERSALCVVGADGLSRDTAFREELAERLPERSILYIDMYYDRDTVSPETHKSLTFPDLEPAPACFFLCDRNLSGYYRYYRFVTGLFGTERKDPVDARFPAYFFVIANGTAVKE